MKTITIIPMLFLMLHISTAQAENPSFKTPEDWKRHLAALFGDRFKIVKELSTEDYFFVIFRDPGAFLICDLPRRGQSHRPSFESILEMSDGSDPVIGWENARSAYGNVKLYDTVEEIDDRGIKRGHRYYHAELLPVRAGIATKDVIVIFRTLKLEVPLNDDATSEQGGGGQPATHPGAK